MNTVHLLYFDGCPNVADARKNLQDALGRAGLKPHWTELDLKSTSCPPSGRSSPLRLS